MCPGHRRKGFDIWNSSGWGRVREIGIYIILKGSEAGLVRALWKHKFAASFVHPLVVVAVVAVLIYDQRKL
jgi:hypothetical protein